MASLLKRSARTDKIVEAAGKLFARHGYSGTSTREIAHLANVSENTLFRHFDHKEDIFWSALRSHSAGLELHQDLLEGLTECDSPEVVLPKILELLTDTISYRPELLRLIAIGFIELQWKADVFCRDQLSPVLSVINQYLDKSIKSGKIRNLDPTMLTSALIMTALTHPGIYNLIDGNKPAYSNSLEAHRAQTRFWLDLLAPKMPSYPLPIGKITEESIG